MSLNRKCELLKGAKDGKRAIYIDSVNKAEIIAYLTSDDRHRKKFQFITDIILGSLRNAEVYDKEEINKKCKDVTAMKFFKGQENDRIYCKEIRSSSGTHIVVAAVLYQKKKTKKLSKEQISIIETVGGYQYDVK